MSPATTLILDGLWAWPGRLKGMLRTVRERCGAAEVFEYDTSGAVRLEKLGEQLIGEIQRIGGMVNLVGYSMGGMVVRAAHLLDPTLPIRRAAFMNTPHGGTWMAYVLRSEGVRQMRPGSEFVKRIAAAEWRVPTLCVWCPGDLIVVPGWRARWERATETVCSGVPAHIWPVFSRGLHRKVCGFLNEQAVEAMSGGLGRCAVGGTLK